ncbi:MAG TPA: DUF2807 domain-containing protein [Caulobacterales bacterium]|nr:DUF2807 domain-containing protein [Caulobacterales bacterium]
MVVRAISILIAGAALAATLPAEAQTFTARTVEIVDAAAVLRVIPEDRPDFSVETTPGPRLSAPRARMEGDRLVIDGRVRISNCGAVWRGHEPSVRIVGVGSVPRSALPVITIRAPRTVDLSTHGAVFANIGASAGGRLSFDGCGDSTVGAASGDLEVNLHGSGDVDVGPVAGMLQASLRGSGDLRAGDAQSARLALAGSGDVSMETVRQGPLEASLGGSGDLRVASVLGGAVTMRLAGSGDLAVAQGSADRLDAQLAGSGDLTFAGHVGVLDARLSGSGDLRVASADRIEGMHKAGSGDITVGN